MIGKRDVRDIVIEIGILTLGDYASDPRTGSVITEQQRILDIIEAAKLADELGLDVFGVGESHQEHFVSQAHTVILGAIAASTKQIKLTSSATIISTSDPVRVYEDFSTIDLISNGRAEIIAGRASRIGLFELLGYDINDYEEFFDEKFDLLLKLNKEQPLRWAGLFRPPLKDAVLYPKPKKGSLPIWRAVGGAPYSAVAAGKQGVPMMLANLAGPVSLFKHSVDAYKKYYKAYGHDESNMKIGITNLFYVHDSKEVAFETYFVYLNQGFLHSNGNPMNKEAYVNALDIENVLMVGDVDTIVAKILHQYDAYGHDRVMFQVDLGGMLFSEVKRNIEVIGKEIMSRVKKEINSKR